MHVTHVTAALSRAGGGLAAAVWSLAAAQRARGVDVFVAGLDDAFLAADVPVPPPAPFVACPARFTTTVRYAPALARTLAARAARTDVVHQHGCWLHPAHAAARFAAVRGLPRIVSLHGALLPAALRHSRWNKRLAWHAFAGADLRTADCLHATSGAEAAAARRLGLRQPIALVPLGVDAAAGATIDPVAGSRTVVFLARLHPGKGAADLLHAWARVVPRHPGWHLELAGPDEGGHRAMLERLATDLGLRPSVTFAGALYGDQKRALLARAALLVLPSHGENFGQVVAEGLAAGLPVITTRATPWEDLETWRCGWWVDTGVDGLAAALDTALAATAAERVAMGARGRALVAARYDWPRVAEAFAQVYGWLAGDGAMPACLLVADGAAAPAAAGSPSR